VLKGPVSPDSPLFQLFQAYPGVSMSHEVTDVFRDRVKYSTEFRTRLAVARAKKPKAQAVTALRAIEQELGNIAASERGVVGDLLLSYRAVEAFDAMVSLYDRMSGDLQSAPMMRQQLAFALNRRKQAGDRDRAIALLEDVRRTHGDSAETLGLLGRVYKDLWQEAKARQDFAAEGWLDEAIAAYSRGFEVEPLDYYPGINALTLLLQKGDDASLAQHKRLAPLVTFAAVRKGGEKAADYWTLATMIELGCHDRDFALARRCFPRAVALVQKSAESWMLKTTRDNLRFIAERFGPEDGAPVAELAGHFDAAMAQLDRPGP
jgi:tetratricopeptide (TPR) repeat protein